MSGLIFGLAILGQSAYASTPEAEPELESESDRAEQLHGALPAGDVPSPATMDLEGTPSESVTAYSVQSEIPDFWQNNAVDRVSAETLPTKQSVKTVADSETVAVEPVIEASHSAVAIAPGEASPTIEPNEAIAVVPLSAVDETPSDAPENDPEIVTETENWTELYDQAYELEQPSTVYDNVEAAQPIAVVPFNEIDEALDRHLASTDADTLNADEDWTALYDQAYDLDQMFNTPEEDGAIAQSVESPADGEEVDEAGDPIEPSTLSTEATASALAGVEPIENFRPLLQFQAASIYQDDEISGRLRATALYALNDQVMFGATVDLVGGSAFVDSADEGLSLNELYVSAAPFRELPNLRFVGGLIDLTSYFDRNSFAKDVVTHFFNPVFQTNPALSAAGIGSRPGALVNWSATDQLEVKLAAFSSSRNLGDLALDGLAAEVGFRSGNFIIRGTVATARDAGNDSGFEELFQIQRDDGSFGLSDDDREIAYGLNVEYFIDSINVGLFGRYGWYENRDVGRSGSTFSLGMNALDLFLEGDRLGLGYGQQLSNGDLRSGKTPDVWEVFYDAPVYENVRAGVSLQSRDEFSETLLGIRIRADW
ncbi:hypothetical protein PN498_10060 [Oscillatoria sp. CS-180]|uniref:hypothetical protein n=1 Tax=Oscillatoria sp. CS-180 TaxID=3021720 RepID=UPI00232EDA1E|nr:hypothetical protein [Oscillatoria sp. CS-180]MDB9526330.1 hypothetical protein [Oscillatoria sp. CS-180]